MLLLQGEAKHDKRGEGSFEDQTAQIAVYQAEAEGGCVTRARGYRSLEYATLPHDESLLDYRKDGPRSDYHVYNARRITSELDLLGNKTGVLKMRTV